jgi:hypothetical protein
MLNETNRVLAAQMEPRAIGNESLDASFSHEETGRRALGAGLVIASGAKFRRPAC